jgi:hypothetical protein
MEAGRQRSHVYIDCGQAASAAAAQAQAAAPLLAPVVPFIASALFHRYDVHNKVINPLANLFFHVALINTPSAG